MRAAVTWLLATLAVVAAAAAFPARSYAADAGECRGLLTCVPVAGPWVEIPAPTRAGVPVTVEYRLRCPLQNLVVGGIDARLADRSIDVSFRGETGSPVGPGVTTSRVVDFVATTTGALRAPTSFRPYIGCVPTSGGGQAQTSLDPPRRLAAFPPTRPLVRHVVDVRLRDGRAAAVARCANGERLVRGVDAVAFRVEEEPAQGLLRSVSVRRSLRGLEVSAAARVSAGGRGVRVELQVQAVCAKRLG